MKTLIQRTARQGVEMQAAQRETGCAAFSPPREQWRDKT